MCANAMVFTALISPLVLGGCVSNEGGLLGVAEIGADKPATETAEAAKPTEASAKGQRVASATPRNGTISGSRELDEMIAKAADANDVPRELAYAVVRVESRYNPKAVGPGGVYGLSQIKPATARSLGFSGSAQDLLDPETNLKYGMKYLSGAWHKGDRDVCATSMKYKGGHRATTMTQSARAYCSSVKQHMASISGHPMGTSDMARLQPSAKSAPKPAPTQVASKAPAAAKPATTVASAPAAATPVQVASNVAVPAVRKAAVTPAAAAMAPAKAAAATPAAMAVETAMKVPVPGHAARPVADAPKLAASSQSFGSIPVPQHAASFGFEAAPDPARFGQ
ncbi:transglycosylase SLT domain-containing protein [Aureimonas altamirensis]|uniref:lytic transglycosylase domain-containing protein n=1 Tax=Aureimonas altamirensis TaxID=370622 RepID=UPI001E3DBA12|nr:transglycosylase SLT domain-containing protein [Aureimonas altamirensis]UHD47233.1 transglycosylase SLT domain-containing protein [Aureimonas altamirensis]